MSLNARSETRFENDMFNCCEMRRLSIWEEINQPLSCQVNLRYVLTPWGQVMVCCHESEKKTEPALSLIERGGGDVLIMFEVAVSRG